MIPYIFYLINARLSFSALGVESVNVGWKEYMKENIEEFHDIPLVWEKDSKVSFTDNLRISPYVDVAIPLIKQGS